MTATTKPRVVYVIGAGFSAGLGFPTIGELLPRMWGRIEASGLADDLSKVIRFHHPSFNPALPATYPDIEQLLSEMEANAQLFDSSRPATGNFTSTALEERREAFLLELANWFHDLRAAARASPSPWLSNLIERIKAERAQVISFNWDLILDEELMGENLDRSSYGLGKRRSGPRLIKPHGSLNWYERGSGRYITDSKKFSLAGTGRNEVFVFKEYRAPKSTIRGYMPLIVPPLYLKQFRGALFKRLWQQTVSVLSTATEVRFLGYSLPISDFHARFILRCGFDNQEHGELKENGSRATATGRARVTIVDPAEAGPKRIEDAVGWACEHHRRTVQEWVDGGALK